MKLMQNRMFRSAIVVAGFVGLFGLVIGLVGNPQFIALGVVVGGLVLALAAAFVWAMSPEP